MTAGHKHRVVRVKHDGLIYRVLTKPRLHDNDRHHVYSSRFAYGVCPTTDKNFPTCWTLSILGVLHGLFGLTLQWEDDDSEELLP